MNILISRILAADVNWPQLLLVIEYAECIGTYQGEQQAAFQTVLLGDIENGAFVNVTGMCVVSKRERVRFRFSCFHNE